MDKIDTAPALLTSLLLRTLLFCTLDHSQLYDWGCSSDNPVGFAVAIRPY